MSKNEKYFAKFGCFHEILPKKCESKVPFCEPVKGEDFFREINFFARNFRESGNHEIVLLSRTSLFYAKLPSNRIFISLFGAYGILYFFVKSSKNSNALIYFLLFFFIIAVFPWSQHAFNNITLLSRNFCENAWYARGEFMTRLTVWKN